VIKGSACLSGSDLGPETVRFVQSSEAAAPLCAGPNGATFIVLSFDHDAAESYGGSVLGDLRGIAS
jgi:hypothetical protein